MDKTDNRSNTYSYIQGLADIGGMGVYTGPGRLFPREPVNFVHRIWTVSQKISKDISKVLANLTYFYHFLAKGA